MSSTKGLGRVHLPWASRIRSDCLMTGSVGKDEVRPMSRDVWVAMTLPVRTTMNHDDEQCVVLAQRDGAVLTELHGLVAGLRRLLQLHGGGVGTGPPLAPVGVA